MRDATGGVLRGDFLIDGISNDTRTLNPGDLYIALAGRGNHDGHDFIATAFAHGANGVLLSHDPCEKSLLVADTFTAMEAMGRAARTRLSPAARIVAITGSVGKTSCRALTEAAFQPFGVLHASTASLNNQWGVPLSLARMPRDTQFGVFEVGMNHAGEITPLSQQIRPHVAIITNIEAIHIGNFNDGIEGIARAKAEIFAGLEPDGIAILPADSPQLPLLEAEAARYGIKTIIRFGSSAGADMRLLTYERRDEGGQVYASWRGREFSFYLAMRSEHHALNALAALAATQALGLDLQQATGNFATIANVEGRGNSHLVTLTHGGQITVLDDRHNSSPVALKAAIREFTHVKTSGRRILALGDMLELGDAAPMLHESIAPGIIDHKIDLVLTCGPLMEHLHRALPAAISRHYPDSPAMADAIGGIIRDGDAILVKGSRGAQMIHVVDALNRMGQST